MLNITIEAFLLGISTGAYCFSQCGIVFVPYIFSESRNGVSGHFPLVLQFLAGRFAAYAIVGLFVGYLGQVMYGKADFVSNAVLGIIIGISYLVLSSLLILNAVLDRKENSCRFAKFKKYSYYPALLGIFTGLNVCPPFILAITKAFSAGSVITGTVFFIMFFVATSVFILPFIFSGLLRRTEAIKNIARITSVLAGIYLAAQGISYIFNTA